MVGENTYIEIEARQINHQGERICGDVFLKRRIKEENRMVAVLSDGMGHGVKANVLASLTATMAINFIIEHRDPVRIAEIIMKTLPVCKERKIAYATFTAIDIDNTGKIHILEYDTPHALAFREKKPLKLVWKPLEMKIEKNNPDGFQNKTLWYTSFYPRLQDRLVFFSDGVAQSGLGTENFPFGWGNVKIQKYIEGLIENDIEVSAAKISEKVVNRSVLNDGYTAKDDISCACMYFRKPRKLLLVTGPPFDFNQDKQLANTVDSFDGKKIVCGGTTIEILSRELKRDVTDSLEFYDPDLPPFSYMDGIDLVTEGILTLNKVNRILKDFDSNYITGKGPADRIVKMLHQSDQINLIVGTKINEAHQDPNVPVDLEIRRTIALRLARLLEDKFLKEVKVSFI
ncbi:MAG TPA: SpoIIE family protein phosphatase [Bacteroidales bacterium]|nr:SpoIIE family protein phosphatase [Bacteroidales bacterium]HXK81339.1 SpoIIE family protein phosphatase [Bacteroidales bacterium]